ncbi:MAG: LytR C-terminal domain-containing protein [Candidatus Delongbacteria bacterium]|nr:LytR C-terminal domain-containing protein [Candidatus Delongbacteria bacterium]
MLRNLIGFGLISGIISLLVWLPYSLDRSMIHQGSSFNRIKIQIMNGTSQQGAARDLMYHLIQQQFDVLSIENYPRTDFPFSLVIDRKNRGSELQRLKRATGLKKALSLPDQTIYDFTIILGKDMLITP